MPDHTSKPRLMVVLDLEKRHPGVWDAELTISPAIVEATKLHKYAEWSADEPEIHIEVNVGRRRYEIRKLLVFRGSPKLARQRAES